MQYLTIWDFIITPFVLLIAILIARRIQRNNIDGNDAYVYYTKGLIAKLAGAFGLCVIYAFYYGGGDTINYWNDAGRLVKLIFHDFECGFRLLVGDSTPSNYFCFDRRTTGLPLYFPKDIQSYTVVRLTALLHFLSVESFFSCSLIMSVVAYTGTWRLYLVFCSEYPHIKKEMSYAILFIPSVLFWGSGILKDTWTFAAVGWLTYGVYNIVIKRKGGVFRNVIYILIASNILIAIKPYIFVALLPGIIIWVVYGRLTKIRNPVVRVLATPIMLMFGVVGASFLFSQTSGSLGTYGDIDATLQKAAVTQEDLKREAYEGNSFDIGSFEPTIPGILSKAPIAIFSGLFRPTLLDVNNVVMLISAIENTFLMIFFIVNLFKIGPFSYLKNTAGEPLSLFALTFSLFLSFAVGLTTSNFGSLVRYRIPATPFFLAGLFIARHQTEKASKQAVFGK